MEAHKSLSAVLRHLGKSPLRSYFITSGSFLEDIFNLTFRADFYVVCACKSGEIHLELDGEKHIVGANQVFVSAPSAVLGFLDSQVKSVIKLLLFKKNFITKNSSNPYFIESMGVFKKVPYRLFKTTDDNFDRLYGIMTYLEKTNKRKGRFTEEIAITIIVNLFLEIAEIAAEGDDLVDKIAHKNAYVEFMELVRENALTHREVVFYADKLHLTSKYLLRIIKKASGQTPSQIIDQSVLKEAFVFLADIRYDISEVAFETGFNSASAFSRFFKKHTGISPSEYRARLIIS